MVRQGQISVMNCTYRLVSGIPGQSAQGFWTIGILTDQSVAISLERPCPRSLVQPEACKTAGMACVREVVGCSKVQHGGVYPYLGVLTR